MGINPGSVSNGNLKSALVVTSPLNGTVSNVFAKIGSYADVSSPVIEIVDNSSLHLDLQVFEKDLPQVKVGQTIHFTITNNPSTKYDATVFSIGSSFENDSKTIAVHCRVNGNKKGLIDGMNITGIVSLSNVTTPAVPNDAIVNADGKYYIFVQTDKKAEEHHEEGEEEGSQKEGEEKKHKNSKNFEKVEVLKGVSDMGYTAVTFVNEIPANAKIVTKGAFFVNAKLSNTGGHEH
jgi:multidrug efflux pump subunit AcrA (membrane-fusion protein)